MWGKAYEVKRGREGGEEEGEEMKREKGTEGKRKNEGGGETAKKRKCSSKEAELE